MTRRPTSGWPRTATTSSRSPPRRPTSPGCGSRAGSRSRRACATCWRCAGCSDGVGCSDGPAALMGNLVLLRHGETEWSLAGRHTGRTDIPLTRHGEECAAVLVPVLAGRHIVAAFTSPAQRAVRTAALSGLAGAKPDPDLWEWDYGGYE